MPAIVPFADLDTRFAWTPWGLDGADQVFDVDLIDPVSWPYARWPAWGVRKPLGGLWLSPLVDTRPLSSEWSMWCDQHSEQSGQTVEITLTDTARVCVLESAKDIELLASRFPIGTESPSMDGFIEPAVDWVALGEVVDAVYVTHRADQESKDLLKPYPRSASGWWEVASMLIYRRETVSMV